MIKMEYIPTQENIADVFMKALARPRFKEFVEGLGLRELEGRSGEQMLFKLRVDTYGIVD